MDSNYTVITSFSKAGFEEYGENFISSFFMYWPESVKLVIYSEDDLPVVFPEHVEYRNLKSVPLYVEFMKAHESSKLANGREYRKGMRWKGAEIANGYSFRYDAIKFCKKVFAIGDLSKEVDGRLFWVDADVVTLRKIPNNFLKGVLPKDKDICFLGRSNIHSECGFMGYNLNSEEVKKFIAAHVSEYSTGSVYDLPEWHDSYVFDFVRRSFNLREKNLSTSNRGHVWITSPLGEYMDHLKGDRKQLGRSPELDEVGVL